MFVYVLFYICVTTGFVDFAGERVYIWELKCALTEDKVWSSWDDLWRLTGSSNPNLGVQWICLQGYCGARWLWKGIYQSDRKDHFFQPCKLNRIGVQPSIDHSLLTAVVLAPVDRSQIIHEVRSSGSPRSKARQATKSLHALTTFVHPSLVFDHVTPRDLSHSEWSIFGRAYVGQ